MPPSRLGFPARPLPPSLHSKCRGRALPQVCPRRCRRSLRRTPGQRFRACFHDRVEAVSVPPAGSRHQRAHLPASRCCSCLHHQSASLFTHQPSPLTVRTFPSAARPGMMRAGASPSCGKAPIVRRSPTADNRNWSMAMKQTEEHSSLKENRDPLKEHQSPLEEDQAPLKELDEWDDFVATRYRQGKSEDEFRNYKADANPTVTEFYRQNHKYQTLDFVLKKKAEYCGLKREKKSIWEMAEYLNTLVDDSDPDTDVTQIEHLLQTAEAIRKDGHPRWFILAGFLHDLGKVLCLYGEPQWAVVGDTFPAGCAYSDQVVFPEFFSANPDSNKPEYQTQYGIYEPNCGLDSVHLSFGHDEYIFRVTEKYLPQEAQYVLRYHSFYAAHRHGAYRHLMNGHDEAMFEWVRKFNPYDLYSKGRERPNTREILPYYRELVSEFFPDKIDW